MYTLQEMYTDVNICINLAYILLSCFSTRKTLLDAGMFWAYVLPDNSYTHRNLQDKTLGKSLIMSPSCSS